MQIPVNSFQSEGSFLFSRSSLRGVGLVVAKSSFMEDDCKFAFGTVRCLWLSCGTRRRLVNATVYCFVGGIHLLHLPEQKILLRELALCRETHHSKR